MKLPLLLSLSYSRRGLLRPACVIRQGRLKVLTTPTSLIHLKPFSEINMIEYKGFIGHFSFDEKTNLFSGRVANSHDLITFQGKSLNDLRFAFHDAVNEYISWRKKFNDQT